MKTQKIILLFSVSSLTLLSLLTLVTLVNINKKTKEFIDVSFNYLKQFPSTQINNSSRELDHLMSKIGLQKVNTNNINNQENTTDNRENQEFINIENSLNNFWKNKLTETNRKNNLIPEDLQTFLRENEQEIMTIRDYIFTSEKPTWNYNLEYMFKNPVNYQIPRLVEILNLQKILMLKILSDYNQDKISEVQKTLEVSFKLNQSLQSQSYLISQLVSMIIAQYQSAVMRQIGDNPNIWAKNPYNNYYSYQEGILTALNIESLIIGSPFFVEGEIINFNAIFKLFEKPYWQLMTIDTSKRMKIEFENLKNQDICSFNIQEIETKLDNPPWWNYYGKIASPNFTNQWIKSGLIMLDLELTNLILAAELSKQKTGQYPDSLPNLNSQICPQEKWQYYKDQEKITLKFSQDLSTKFPSNNSENNVFSPLTFTIKNN